MRKIIIGVMGPGNASPTETQNAYDLGFLIAQNHWVLLTGGRNSGVMQAASRGAKAANGLTVGILPTAHVDVAETVDLAIFTDMGSARNNINVLSSNVVIACGMGAGTASEVALAIKANKPVILLSNNQESQRFFTSLSATRVFIAKTAVEAIAIIKDLI